jgi:BASS family bile acid:Na+ symporter
MVEFLTMTFKISVLIFVVGSMVSMGLSLTVKQIIDPLKNVRLVILALVANFILVPALVFLMNRIIPLSSGFGIGLILLSIAAGAPFLPKLADIARSNVAFSIGLMLLLMVVTIFYLPLVLPHLLEGAQVSSWDIAKSLITLMLIPLILALLFRAWLEKPAAKLQPVFAKLTNLAMLVLTIALVILNSKHLISMIGMPLLAIVVFLVVAMAIGYLLGGPGKDTRVVLALGTGQRNISAAILVATQNFKDPDITLMLVSVAIFGLFIMIPYAKSMARHAG